MRTRTAIIQKQPSTIEVVELDLDEPRQNELMIKMTASGLCHSDLSMVNAAVEVPRFPFALGHEGAGVVHQVGPNTPGWQVGDHVVFAFLPFCGRCRWCATGHQNLCDLGATVMHGSRFDDIESFRMSYNGQPTSQMGGISTFSEYTTISVNSAVKVLDHSISLRSACLLGCGVPTGWGSAVKAAEVYPGHTVIVMGIGGVGMSAVQGARAAGAGNVIAVDPVPFKLEKAMELGATHVYADIAQAADFARSVTNGQGADSAIVTVGETSGKHIAQAFAAIRKAGTVVVTGVGPEPGIPDIALIELVMMQKRIQGSIFGMANPSTDVPWLLEQYQSGRLKLDEMITKSYTLDTLNEGFEDMLNGTIIRGVVEFD